MVCQENFYGGVNLATLLFTSETYTERQVEIEAIWSVCAMEESVMILNILSSKLNGKVAQRGGIKSCDNYWDIASFFEVLTLKWLFIQDR